MFLPSPSSPSAPSTFATDSSASSELKELGERNCTIWKLDFVYRLNRFHHLPRLQLHSNLDRNRLHHPDRHCKLKTNKITSRDYFNFILLPSFNPGSSSSSSSLPSKSSSSAPSSSSKKGEMNILPPKSTSFH